MTNLNFEALRDLHNSANNLLHSPKIQEALADYRQEKWVNEVSEASLTMLDICSISKDVLSLVKHHLQDLQFTLRRVTINDGETDFGNKIAAYNCYRKMLKKETLKCLNCLKGMKSKSVISGLISIPIDHNLRVVVDVLRKVRIITISIVESLFSLIAIPWLDRRLKGSSFATMLIMKVSGQNLYDVCDLVAVQNANKKILEAIEIAIEELEMELECMIRRLIETRVALLNILTN